MIAGAETRDQNLVSEDGVELLTLRRLEWTPFGRVTRVTDILESGEYGQGQSESNIRSCECKQLWCVCLAFVFLVLFCLSLYMFLRFLTKE